MDLTSMSPRFLERLKAIRGVKVNISVHRWVEVGMWKCFCWVAIWQSIRKLHRMFPFFYFFCLSEIGKIAQ